MEARLSMLYCSLKEGHVDRLKEYLIRGGDPNIKLNKSTLLHTAIEYNNQTATCE